MKKLTNAQIIERAMNSHNKMIKDMGRDEELTKIEDFEIIHEEKEVFTDRAFHIDNGVSVLKSGELFKSWVMNKIDKDEYIINQYMFTNCKDSIDINYLG